MDANLSRGNLVIRGSGAELEVRRAAPIQVYAAFEALREAGVPEGVGASRDGHRA